MQSKLFQQRLKGLRKEKGITLERLAKEIGTTKVTLSRYENGDRSPKLEFVAALSNYFNVEMTWLAGVDSTEFPKAKNDDTLKDKFNKELNKEQDGKHTESVETFLIQSQLTPPRQQNVLTYAKEQLEEQNNESDKVVPFITITRYHATAAGVIGEELFDDLLEEDVDFREDEVPKGADFCVLVNGDSMEPMIKEGSYAFIKKTDTVTDGTIALVVLDGASYIKRVDIHPEYLKLISLNPKYEDITVSSFNDLKVIGKVVL